MTRSIDATVAGRWRDRLRRFEVSDLTVTAYGQVEGVSLPSCLTIACGHPQQSALILRLPNLQIALIL